MPNDLIGKLAHQFFNGEYGELHIDSRKVRKGDAFLALPGTRTHGNAFVEVAVKKGATLVLVDKKVPYKRARGVVAVSQPEKFLWKLAQAIVKLSSAKRVAITGSNGKTTTKDLTALALGGEGKKVLKTQGNYNNHLGVPLTLCRLKHHHQFAIIEIGTSGVGEIKSLTRLAKPHMSVLTSVNAAHMEGLKNLQAVALEKSDIFRGLKAGSLCFLRQKEMKFTTVKSSIQGLKPEFFDLNHVEARLSFKKNKMTWFHNNIEFSLATPAIHNVENAEAAIRVAEALGESTEVISKRMSKWMPSAHRMCVLNWRKRTLIDDCYNANPASMIAAVQSALNLKKRNEQKVLLAMADMKEMGKRSGKVHGDLGKDLAKLGIDVLLTMGEDSFKTLTSFEKNGGESSMHCESTEQMGAMLQTLSRPHDIVLIKGSRGMHLEEVIHQLDPKLESALA